MSEIIQRPKHSAVVQVVIVHYLGLHYTLANRLKLGWTVSHNYRFEIRMITTFGPIPTNEKGTGYVGSTSGVPIAIEFQISKLCFCFQIEPQWNAVFYFSFRIRILFSTVCSLGSKFKIELLDFPVLQKIIKLVFHGIVFDKVQ